MDNNVAQSDVHAGSAQTGSLVSLLDKDLSKSSLSDMDKTAFDNNMQIFLHRANVQKLDEQGEVDNTLKQCDRLLNPQSNELFLDGQFGKEEGARLRTLLAEEIMQEAAYPSQTVQGHFCTCSVAAIETHTWFDRPSVAAEIVADQALTGQWASVDGKVVKLPKIDFTPDKYSKQAVPSGVDYRNYAEQLFQATAMSDAGLRQDTPVYFVTDGVSTGEDGKESAVQYWSDAEGKQVQLFDGLGPVSLAQEFARIDGSNTEVLSADASVANPEANVIIFNGKEDLIEKLKEAQESGKMPVIIDVAAGDKFLANNGAHHHMLDHYICIDKFDPKTGNLVIDNQWSPKSDWGTTSVLGSATDVRPEANIDDFFSATQGESTHDPPVIW